MQISFDTNYLSAKLALGCCFDFLYAAKRRDYERLLCMLSVQGRCAHEEKLCTRGKDVHTEKGVHTKERCAHGGKVCTRRKGVHTGERCAHGRKLNTKIRVRYNFNVGGVIEMLSSVRN